ncbi:MAG TPA: hypothetical protein DEQ20_02625 [Desulfobulbaceae bacterium]|jgi:hypothetical protein|nr:MAG: hypothetical protein A2520_01500 [Deltaproteobacteria bacterium RIFOXYD12_FULL_53_23]HCC53808.1 hypothetical protein [Desulfobulbaceae bacterium]
MKFIIKRSKMSMTENRQVCDEAVQEKLTLLDYRSVGSMEEAQKKIWFKDWIADGINHREEDGMVVCEKKEKPSPWVVDIASLEELLIFQDKYGEITIANSIPYVEVKKEITIL